MLLALLLAGLTGFAVHRKNWGWATFTGLLFLYFMWLTFISIVNLMWARGGSF